MNDKSSDYDQVYLIPLSKTGLDSRTEPSLCSDFDSLYPIFSSPMAEISGSELVIEMGRNNCLGILHRFQKTYNDRFAEIDTISNANVPFGVAIGVNNFLETEFNVAAYAVEKGASLICVDCANGYMPKLKNIGQTLRKNFGNDFSLMSGNVITIEGLKHLVDCGFNFIRVGIGNGTVCSTRDVTGIGRNQLAALKECFYNNDTAYIVSDGGIKTPGSAVKSLALADFVMLGSILAQANEAENKEGLVYGMASRQNHENQSKEIKSIEGISMQIDPFIKKPLKEILDQFLWGIRSACSYLGCNSYKNIWRNSKFVPINETF